MVAFLTKPLHVAQLARALERWVGQDARLEKAAGMKRREERPDGESEESVALMDFSRLEEFREFDDEEQTMIREVVAMFIAEVPQRLAVIEAAVAQPATSAPAHCTRCAGASKRSRARRWRRPPSRTWPACTCCGRRRVRRWPAGSDSTRMRGSPRRTRNARVFSSTLWPSARHGASGRVPWFRTAP